MDSSLFARLENGNGYAQTNAHNILNPYVNFNNHKGTQSLFNTLVQESIQMRGIEFFYLEREFVNLDLLFGEDPGSQFNKAWKFAAYLNTFDAYAGSGASFNMFDFSQSDEITISVNPELFKYQVNNKEPKIGDLLYFGMDKSLFEITWVEPYNPFYQAGQNAIRKIIASKYIYSGEEIKPELQVHPDIDETTFGALDLEPLHNLSGRTDITNSQTTVEDQVATEASAFVDPFEVVNGSNDYFKF